MRGYIEGTLWGLIIGGIVVTAVSVIDDRVDQGETAAVTPPRVVVDDTAPSYLRSIAVLQPAPATGALPRIPDQTRAPFVDRWVIPLTNVARRPELPLLDGNSAPVPAEPEIDDNPQTEPVAAAQETAEPLPQVDTAEAPVVAPAPTPQIISPTEDGAQVEQSTQDDAEQSQQAARPVVINRIGTEPADVPGQTAEIVDAPDELPEDAPALLRYASVFENPENLPTLAIILFDETGGAGPQVVADLGFAPTVVVNALAEDASDRMAGFRSAGAEVALTLALPQGAQPVDVEVAFEAAVRVVPNAALLFSSAGDAVQSNRQVTAQVMDVLAARGLGFVAVERGLGGAIRSAEQVDVPAVAVARVLDGNNESAGAMMRALDQAAFRARQSGDAVILASMDAQTLEVLQEWAAENAGNGTAIGPVSGILLDAE